MYGTKYIGTARNTFVIDERGLIEDIIEKVDTKNHTSQILKDNAGSPSKEGAPKTKAAKK
jgi:peroxiredoxin Q/BCP